MLVAISVPQSKCVVILRRIAKIQGTCCSIEAVVSVEQGDDIGNLDVARQPLIGVDRSTSPSRCEVGRKIPTVKWTSFKKST